MHTSDTDKRSGYIAGLRQLADLLEQHDELPLPWTGSSRGYAQLQWIETPETPARQLEMARMFTRLIPGTVNKDVQGEAFYLTAALDGLHVQLIVNRDAVCERVVTGVETVTEQVPDPEALAAVPLVEVTREVEHVEWVCGPILADRDPVAAVPA